jgi:uncharacterized protein (TIGR00661 family)
MKIHYGVLMQGQGHLNRSAALIRVLRSRGHHVNVLLAGDSPPSYAREAVGDFEFLNLPNLTLENGRLRYRRTARAFFGSMPRRISHATRLAQQFARRRVDLVLSDFEPITAWAACLSRAPSAGIAGQYRMTRTDARGPSAPVDRALTHGLVESWTPGLSRYFAVSFAPVRPTRRQTQVVGPIVDPSFRARTIRREGFFLAYLYSYSRERVLAALAGHGRFRVYGMGAAAREGDVEFLATDRTSFVEDLSACEGVVFNGSFQGVCEAAVLGKPVLSIPFASQYEEAFNAFQVANAGLGASAQTLGSEAIADFTRRCRAGEWNARAALEGDGAAQIVEALGL